MPNINKKLSYNKHPKDCDNLSLIDAVNIKLSNDTSVLSSEDSIVNTRFNNYIESAYPDAKIIGYIPCNNEFILIYCNKNEYNEANKNNFVNPITAIIFRFNEKINRGYIAYDKLEYNGGELKGTFTYNSNNQLIIAIAENSRYKDVPLKTLNLGIYNQNDDNTDVNLINDLISLSPKVYIPKLNNVEYIKGNMPKGWYYLFIRYKINKYDYTQWFNIGYPIFISTLVQKNLIKVHGYTGSTKYSTGCFDYISGDLDISEESINFDLSNIDTRYKFYQLSFICVTKSNQLVFRTSDIKIDTTNYTLSLDSFNIKDDAFNIITNNYNFYNVDNVINYQNRIYIANYKEKEEPDFDTSQIELSYKIELNSFTDNKYLINNYRNGEIVNQYESNSKYWFDLCEVNNIPKNTIINIKRVLKANPTITSYYIVTPTNIHVGTVLNDIDYTDYVYPNNTDYDSGDVSSLVTIKDEEYDGLTFESTERLILHYNGTTTPPDGSYIITLNVDNIKRTIIFSIDPDTYKFKCTNSDLSVEREYSVYIGEADSWTYQIKDSLLNVKKDNLSYTNVEIYIGNEKLVLVASGVDNNDTFINTKESYNYRKLNTTLIPGEIYNFFIHFVDEYGFVTRGYRINNNIKLYTDHIPIKLITTSILFPINQNIFNDDNTINFNGCKSVIDVDTLKDLRDINESEKKELYNKFSYLSSIPNIKWYDVCENYIIYKFIPYINSNGDRLFKVPEKAIEYSNDIDCKYIQLNIDITNIKLPKGYVGYFFSYEKFESTKKITGYLTRNDFINYDYTIEDFTNENKNNNGKMLLYSSKFNIEDTIDFKYNLLKLREINFTKQNINIISKFANNFYVANCNMIPDFGISNIFKFYGITSYNILAAGDSSNNRFGVGTALELDNIYGLFDENSFNMYEASLYYINHDIYTNTNKKLIKFTDIFYDNSKIINIKNGLNGHITYDGVLVYNSNKCILNTTTTKMLNTKMKEYADKIKFVTYVQFATYEDKMFESKSFKNEPLQTGFYLSDTTQQEGEFRTVTSGQYISPENSIDLFENKYTNQDELNPKIYINRDDNTNYTYRFNKTIRRSHIIQDESLVNSWRNFSIEDYKIISENKGIITNLVGIGTILLVHTEHSLFMFNRDNTLQTEDKAVQLTMPDIFDVDYKELITSDLGYAGLQDNKSYIVDQFGYIFYDSDKHRIYRFDNKTLDYIDTDIVQFMNIYKPNYIRFINDKNNNRLLLKIIHGIQNEFTLILSYNYLIGNFISRHEYSFSEGFNTKNYTYLINNSNNKIFTFSQNDSYNKFEIIDNQEIKSSKISIIINDAYEVIKVLEYITYKLYIIDKLRNFNTNPVEEHIIPYSGNTIRVHNDLIDTGELDILIDNESSKNVFNNYKKPYWNLGNWNFNYLRDIANSNLMSKLYGNYFIIDITFKNENERRIEFETLNYYITKEK